MTDVVSTERCAVTGVSGYVGGRMKEHAQRAGFQVVEWSRKPASGPHGISFQLGQDVRPEMLAGTNALVHCAYDFKVRSWDEIMAVNVHGSEKILRAASAAGVRKMIFISSISAYDGCRSLYGRAKLEIESIALSLGAVVIRPGLVYGDTLGGVFAGLVKQVKSSRFVPLLGGGQQVQYLVHDVDLGRVIERCLLGEILSAKSPVTLAHEKGWEIRELMKQVGARLGKKVSFIPVPWRLAWLGLKTAEVLGLPTRFRSDSLIGLIYQNPSPSFELAKTLKAECRPFTITPSMLA
jgi:nucleoside-diphosphate-sugar epimerase